MSRNPTKCQILSLSFLQPICCNPSDTDVEIAELREDYFTAAAHSIIDRLNCNIISDAAVCSNVANDSLITLKQVQEASVSEEIYKSLINAIETGFPEKRNDTPPDLREYWEVCNRLSSSNGVAFLINELSYHLPSEKGS